MHTRLAPLGIWTPPRSRPRGATIRSWMAFSAYRWSCTAISAYVALLRTVSVSRIQIGRLIGVGQFDCIVVDYLHTRKFPVIGNVAKWGLGAETVVTLVGVYHINTNGIGASISPSRSLPTSILPSISMRVQVHRPSFPFLYH